MKATAKAILIAGCLVVGLAGCASYYDHGYGGDRDCRDQDPDHCHRDRDHRDHGPEADHFRADVRRW